MNVLVTAASRHGSTQQIAEAIAEGLRSRGHEASATALDDATTIDGFDAVVFGSAVYEGRWLKPARTFAKRLETELSAVPTWIFSSGMTGAPDPARADAPPTEAARVAAAIGAERVDVFRGKLDHAVLGPLERTIIRAVNAEEGDFRDWDQIDAFAAEVASSLDRRSALVR